METTTPPACDGSSCSGEKASLNLIETWCRRVQVYWVPLTRNSRPGKIIRRMRLTVDSAVLDEIIDLDSDNKSIEASEKFLLFLISVDGLSLNEIKARWSLFEQALREVHPFLYDIVNGKCDAETHELQKKLVTFFAEEITDVVDPIHIFPDLLASNLVGDMEAENLMRITQQQGPTMGAIYMVSHLPRSTNKNWYYDFLEILMKNGYDELVKKLDDSVYDSIGPPIDQYSTRPVNGRGTSYITMTDLHMLFQQPVVTVQIELKGSVSLPLPLDAMAAVQIAEGGGEGSLNNCGVPSLNEKGAYGSSVGGSLNDNGAPSLDDTDAYGAPVEESFNNCGPPSANEKVAYKPKTVTDDQNCRMWPLSEKRQKYVSVTVYNGETLIHIRKYTNNVKNTDGRLMPTKKGVALTPAEWQILKSMIPVVDAEIDELTR